MEKVFYFHNTNPKKGHRRCTIAGILADGQITLGVSQVSPCDEKKATKSLAREIAEGRARTKPFNVVKVENVEESGKFFNQLAQEISNSDVTKIMYGCHKTA